MIYRSYDFNQPRVSNLLLKDLISDIEFLKDFEKRPLEILQYYGIDTAEINIPENFKMPPQNVLEKRLKYYYENEEFVSPAQHSSSVGVFFIIFLIPIFVY